MAIDIGSGASDRASSVDILSKTIVDCGNPANTGGRLTTFYIYLSATVNGYVVIATHTGSNNLTIRDSANLGVIYGYSSFSGLHLDVVAGDYLGFYNAAIATGALEMATSGGSGHWLKAGTGDGAYTLTASTIISLYGIGTTAPVATTQAASGIGIMHATGNGTLANAGGGVLTERGICYSLTTGPTTANWTVHDHTDSNGAYTMLLSGLLPSTKYYCKAYCISSINTSYGAEVNFTTLAYQPKPILF
jgi:hypothetical protein